MIDYFILSLKWTRGDYCVWWGPENSGYVGSLSDAGRYTEAQIAAEPNYYNDGKDTLAVPCEEALKVARPVVGNRRISDFRKVAFGSSVERIAS